MHVFVTSFQLLCYISFDKTYQLKKNNSQPGILLPDYFQQYFIKTSIHSFVIEKSMKFF